MLVIQQPTQAPTEYKHPSIRRATQIELAQAARKCEQTGPLSNVTPQAFEFGTEFTYSETPTTLNGILQPQPYYHTSMFQLFFSKEEINRIRCGELTSSPSDANIFDRIKLMRAFALDYHRRISSHDFNENPVLTFETQVNNIRVIIRVNMNRGKYDIEVVPQSNSTESTKDFAKSPEYTRLTFNNIVIKTYDPSVQEITTTIASSDIDIIDSLIYNDLLRSKNGIEIEAIYEIQKFIIQLLPKLKTEGQYFTIIVNGDENSSGIIRVKLVSKSNSGDDSQNRYEVYLMPTNRQQAQNSFGQFHDELTRRFKTGV